MPFKGKIQTAINSLQGEKKSFTYKMGEASYTVTPDDYSSEQIAMFNDLANEQIAMFNDLANIQGWSTTGENESTLDMIQDGIRGFASALDDAVDQIVDQIEDAVGEEAVVSGIVSQVASTVEDVAEGVNASISKATGKKSYAERLMGELDPKNQELFKETFLDGTQIGKLSEAEQITFFEKLSESIIANNGSPHLSNQFANKGKTYINTTRNRLKFDAVRTMDGQTYHETSRTIANPGDGKRTMTILEEMVRSGNRSEGDENSGPEFGLPWKNGMFKHSYASFVDQDSAGTFAGESKMNTKTSKAVKKWNDIYDKVAGVGDSEMTDKQLGEILKDRPALAQIKNIIEAEKAAEKLKERADAEAEKAAEKLKKEADAEYESYKSNLSVEDKKNIRNAVQILRAPKAAEERKEEKKAAEFFAALPNFVTEKEAEEKKEAEEEKAAELFAENDKPEDTEVTDDELEAALGELGKFSTEQIAQSLPQDQYNLMLRGVEQARNIVAKKQAAEAGVAEAGVKGTSEGFGEISGAELTTEFKKRVKEQVKKDGKVCFLQASAYHNAGDKGTRAIERKRNAEVKAVIQEHKDYLSEFAVKLSKKGVSDESGQLTPEEVNADLRKFYANEISLDDFKNKYQDAVGDGADNLVSQQGLYDFAALKASMDLYDECNKDQYSKGSNEENSHLFSLAATTGVLQRIFGSNSWQGCKSAKDRESMVRKLTQSLNERLQKNSGKVMGHFQWKSLPTDTSSAEQRGGPTLDDYIRNAYQDPQDGNAGNFNVEMMKDLKNDLDCAENFYENDTQGYFGWVTGLNAVGTEGALGQVEKKYDVKTGGFTRGMMPERFVKIYQVTRPEFLLKKRFDAHCADMNKGANPEYLDKAKKLKEEVDEEYESYKSNLSAEGKKNIRNAVRKLRALEAAKIFAELPNYIADIDEPEDTEVTDDELETAFIDEPEDTEVTDDELETALGELGKYSTKEIAQSLSGEDDKHLLSVASQARNMAAKKQTAEEGVARVKKVLEAAEKQSETLLAGKAFGSFLKKFANESRANFFTRMLRGKRKSDDEKRLDDLVEKVEEIGKTTKLDQLASKTAEKAKEFKGNKKDKRSQMIDHLSKVVLAQMMVNEIEQDQQLTEQAGQQDTADTARNTGRISGEERQKLINDIVDKIENNRTEVQETDGKIDHKEVLKKMEEKSTPGPASGEAQSGEKTLSTTAPKESTTKSTLDDMRKNLGLAKESVMAMYQDIKASSAKSSSLNENDNRSEGLGAG